MRWIGIRHRVKKTAEGEARPTEVAVLEEDGTLSNYELKSDQDELEWVKGNFQLKNRTDGLKPEDRVAMILGGSGDRLAYALSRRGEEIGAQVFRIPSFRLKDFRETGNGKEQGALLLAQLLKSQDELFFPVQPRDRDLIWAIECFRLRQEAMKARIACEQRIRANLVGRIFCSRDGLFPEGSIELQFNEAKANDRILQALLEEERGRERELERALEELEIYAKLFKPIKGVGPMIAARLIVAIQEIRRFKTDARLKAFCGVHVLPDGRFPRRRKGEVANWQPDARQALYLLADQVNRRPATPWGEKFREYKVKFRERHPQVEVVNGKTRYTDGHIHLMAKWRTVTKFTEWLFREWWKIERQD